MWQFEPVQWSDDPWAASGHWWLIRDGVHLVVEEYGDRAAPGGSVWRWYAMRDGEERRGEARSLADARREAWAALCDLLGVGVWEMYWRVVE